MLLLEEVRQTVVGAFKTVHDAHYPTTLVNYENFSVVDIEHQEAPFVNLELNFSSTDQAAMGVREIYVSGILSATFYYQEGHGRQGALSYTDMLNQYLCMQSFDGVHYRAVKPYQVVTFPGWVGTMNNIQFELVPSCS